MDTENKILVCFMMIAFLFFGAGIHTSNHEAERRIEKDFGIEAELNFEKDDSREMNIFEKMELERARLKGETYHIEMDNFNREIEFTENAENHIN